MPPPPQTAALMGDPSKRARMGRCAEGRAGREEGASSGVNSKEGPQGRDRPSPARTGESARDPMLDRAVAFWAFLIIKIAFKIKYEPSKHAWI